MIFTNMRLPKIGERVYISNVSQYSRGNKVCKVTKSIMGVVYYKPLGRRGEDLQCDLADLDYIEDEDFTTAEKKELIKKMIKPGYLTNDSVWRREQGAFNKLFESYPDVNFWRYLDIKYQVRSLFWFIGGGSSDLRKLWNLYSLDRSTSKNDTSLSSNKTGEVATTDKQNQLNF